MKKGVGFYVRKYEKVFLVAALCFSALAPLLKYTLSSSPAFRQTTWDEPSSGVVERSPHADQSEETATRDAMQPLPTPIVCTYADRELAKWQACNKKKFKVIPSCKRGISKCVLLPLYKQKITPFCGDCINEWKKMEDCYKEAETYALTMRRCIKVRETDKRKICGRSRDDDDSPVGGNGGSGGLTITPFRVSRECVLADTRIAKARTELGKMRRIVPRALEMAEKQEKLERLRQRSSGKRGRGSRRRRQGKTVDPVVTISKPPLDGEEGPQLPAQTEQTEPGSNIDYGHVEITAKPQYPSLNIE